MMRHLVWSGLSAALPYACCESLGREIVARDCGERLCRETVARDCGASEGSGVACERLAPNKCMLQMKYMLRMTRVKDVLRMKGMVRMLRMKSVSFAE